MKRWLIALGSLLAVAFVLVLRAGYTSSPSSLEVSAATTVVTEPRDADGGVDFFSAMGATSTTEDGARALRDILRSAAPTVQRCEAVKPELLTQITSLAQTPLRFRKGWAIPYSQLAEDLNSALLAFVPRMRCSCELSSASRSLCLELLVRLAAHLSTSNDDSLFNWQSGVMIVADKLFDGRATEPLSLTSPEAHMQIVQLAMVSDLAQLAAKRHCDVNITLRTFNELFQKARVGALPEGIPPAMPWWKVIFQRGEENRRRSSRRLAIVYGDAARETYRMSREAGEETARVLRKITAK